jgi:hypothetical protein
MNCYICDDAGRAMTAVAICNNCGVALCREHLDEDLLVPRNQGLVRRACTHEPMHAAQARRRRASGASQRGR